VARGRHAQGERAKQKTRSGLWKGGAVFGGLVMKMEIAIEKVESHTGKEFQGTPWKHQMQVIYTNKGLFIDNSPGKCFGRAGIMWKGIDWSQHIGKTVEIIAVNCEGKEKEPVNFKPCTSFKDLTRESGKHSRTCYNHIWAYPLFLLGEPNIIR
jgi:hypothetical protein